MRLLLTILLTAAIAGEDAANVYENVTVERARAFFTAMYHPQVHYDEYGNVKMEGSPLTAGHIYPIWDSATGSLEGKGRRARMVFRVPVNVEREIYTKVASYSEYMPHEMAERELVVTCSIKDGREFWKAVLRYRIIDPDTHEKGKFSGLEIDVNPNHFTALSVKEYRNGFVVMNEKNLDGSCWMHIVCIPVIDMNGKLTFRSTQEGEKQSFVYKDEVEAFVEEAEFQAKDEYEVMGKASTRRTSIYIPVLAIPRVWTAITRYRYFPVTKK